MAAATATTTTGGCALAANVATRFDSRFCFKALARHFRNFLFLLLLLFLLKSHQTTLLLLSLSVVRVTLCFHPQCWPKCDWHPTALYNLSFFFLGFLQTKNCRIKMMKMRRKKNVYVKRCSRVSWKLLLSVWMWMWIFVFARNQPKIADHFIRFFWVFTFFCMLLKAKVCNIM